MTTRKTYDKIAKALHKAFYKASTPSDKEAIVEVVSILCDVFKEENSKFDAVQFSQSVYLEVSNGK